MEQQPKVSLSILAIHQYRKNIERWKKALRERLQILSEILNSQCEYTKTLRFIIGECRQIMVGELKVDAEDFDEVFGCIESISMLHNEFYTELKQRCDAREDPSFKFGDILVRHLPFFKMYSAYMRTLSSHKSILVELKSQGRFARYRELLHQRSTGCAEKYGERLVKYMSNIDVVDYISIPFQRIYNYEMFLTRYVRLLPKSNPDLAQLSQAMVLLKATLNQFNEDVGESQLAKCMELEKKYGCVLMPQRKFQGEFSANYWAGGSKMPTCRIYILSDMLLIVDENTGKLIKRVQMDEQSWYHLLNVGKEINNAVFIKGAADSYQGVFIPIYTLDDFLKIMKKLFAELPNRLSLRNKNPSLIIRPINISRLGKQCIFTLFIKIHGSNGGVYNSLNIAELQGIMSYLIKKHPSSPLFRTLEQVSEMSLNSLADESTLSDFDAELLALSLFYYLAPLMCDFELVRTDEQLQAILNIRDYVAVATGQLSEETELRPLTKAVLRAEDRSRVEEIRFEQLVQINVLNESGGVNKLKIGKEERAYSLIRKIVGKDFSMDFALFISSKVSKMRILNDDDLVYQVMKRQGYVFKQETSYFMQGFRKLDSLFGLKTTQIHLKKYLYLESSYPEMLETIDTQRLQYLTDNILSIMYEQQPTSLSTNKTVQLLSLVLKLKEPSMVASGQQQLLCSFWKQRIKPTGLSQSSFSSQVLSQYSKLCKTSNIECFIKLFNAVQFWPQYAYVVDCKVNETNMKLIIKHRVLEVRETTESETPLLRVDLQELDYMVTPGYIRIRIEEHQDTILEVDWVYGVWFVIERNRHIQRIKKDA